LKEEFEDGNYGQNRDEGISNRELKGLMDTAKPAETLESASQIENWKNGSESSGHVECGQNWHLK